MVKPPKPIPLTTPSDALSTPPRPGSNQSSGPRSGTDTPDLAAGNAVRTPEPSADVAPDATGRLPSVVVNASPESIARLLESNMNSITWPAANAHMLRAIDNGLFHSPQGGTYAQVIGEGYLQVERQTNGRYRVFWPASLGEPGPFLQQIDGQPLWRPDSVDRAELSPEADRTRAGASGGELPSHLTADQANWRTGNTAASPDGLRHDKRGATYVEMEDGTLCLVRRQPEGHYRQASAHERNWLGADVEQIPGSGQWRIKTPQSSSQHDLPHPVHKRPASEADENSPAPGKRPRLAEEQKPDDTGSISGTTADARPLAPATSAGEWRHWGMTLKPEWHDSIDIDGQHYVIVPQRVLPDTTLVFLQHPLFSPGRYDAFEQMLKNNPSLQPKWAIRKDDQWTVVELPSFEKSLTESVATSFRYLADHSLSAIARAAFNEVNHSEVINGDGLRVLFDTFYHWENRTLALASRRELADPLMMLPVLPTQPSAHLNGQTLLLPSPFATGLERIDFDTRLFEQRWREAVHAPGSSLRALFSELLQDNGYAVDRTSRLFSEDALLFQRSTLDVVFVLRLRPSTPDGRVNRRSDPGDELLVPTLRARLARSRWRQMLEPDKVVYLVGGTQTVSAQQTLLFIVREG
jgi:hypothetical protein